MTTLHSAQYPIVVSTISGCRVVMLDVRKWDNLFVHFLMYISIWVITINGYPQLITVLIKCYKKPNQQTNDLHAVSCCVSVVNGLSLSDRFDDTMNLNTTQESDPSIPSAVMASKKEELQKQLRELDKVCLSLLLPLHLFMDSTHIMLR
jgi:hypothetical protein